MKATDIQVGKTYKVSGQGASRQRAKVIERQEKSRWDHYASYKVEFFDVPESASQRRFGVVESRYFDREWTDDDNKRLEDQKKKKEERQVIVEEMQATKHELENAGFGEVNVYFSSSADHYQITFGSREGFDKMLEMLLQRTAEPA